MSQSGLGAKSLADSIEFIKGRDYRALSVIKSTSWEKLDLEVPVLTLEEQA